MTCSGVVLQVLFIPKQLMLVTSGDDSDVRIWDLVNKSCVAVLKVHTFLTLEQTINYTCQLTSACGQMQTPCTFIWVTALQHVLMQKGCYVMVMQNRCCILNLQ